MVRLIDEACKRGASQRKACSELGLDVRTIQRWKAQNVGDDRRYGPKTAPSNKLTEAERKKVVEIATSPAFRDLSPKQIVPKLADAGQFIASESSFYRVLRDEGQLAHRGRANAPSPRAPTEHVATAPCQVWSWDITYLRAPVAGVFYYLYMFVDVWSRKVVGFAVHEVETSELAAAVLERALEDEGITRKGLVALTCLAVSGPEVPRKLTLGPDDGEPTCGRASSPKSRWSGSFARRTRRPCRTSRRSTASATRPSTCGGAGSEP